MTSVYNNFVDELDETTGTACIEGHHHHLGGYGHKGSAGFQKSYVDLGKSNHRKARSTMANSTPIPKLASGNKMGLSLKSLYKSQVFYKEFFPQQLEYKQFHTLRFGYAFFFFYTFVYPIYDPQCKQPKRFKNNGQIIKKFLKDRNLVRPRHKWSAEENLELIGNVGFACDEEIQFVVFSPVFNT